MQKFGGRKCLGMQPADLLEFERGFGRDRHAGTASDTIKRPCIRHRFRCGRPVHADCITGDRGQVRKRRSQLEILKKTSQHGQRGNQHSNKGFCGCDRFFPTGENRKHDVGALGEWAVNHIENGDGAGTA